MSRDEQSGQNRVGRVVRTFQRRASELIRVRLRGGEQIEATPEHPFYVQGKGFVAAKWLRAGLLLSTLGGTVPVEAASPLKRDTVVYNFEVEKSHTYFVGNNQAWVHNQCVKHINRQRHFMRQWKPGKALHKKFLTTAIDDRIATSVYAEETAIMQAEATGNFANIVKANGQYTMPSGRIYGLHGETLYPVSGPGFYQMTRPATEALNIMILNYDNPARAAAILARQTYSAADLGLARTVYSIWKIIHNID